MGKVLPGVYFSQRFPLGKYVAIMMFLWGGVTVCTIAVNSYQGLLAQRFFLGVTEAGIAPAFSLITAMWYKRSEQPLRFAIWFSATGISVLIGSLIFYGIGHIEGRLSAWRYQFMIVGCFSCVWGICLWFLLPDSPLTAFFLSRDMKVVAIERMRQEQIGIENKRFKWDQVREAFKDPKTYLYMVMLFAINLANGAASGFGSIIVQSFGFTTFKTILLLGVAGVFVFVFTLGTGLVSAFWPNKRCYAAMFCCLPVFTGAFMIWRSDWQKNRAVSLWGFFMVTTFSGTQVMILSLVAANTAGHTKKAITSGLVWASYSTSNGIAPLLVKTEEKASHYPSAFIPIIATMVLVFVLLVLYRVYVLCLNKKRDSIRLVDMDEAARTGFLDITDRENGNFRYQA
ncbi:putative transporter [Hyphodiscus hymeniophilus]|uniref:Transporter n=1 Tax=Hyphodiscus hymeniophilus TaxID=353542 RepID=A0A9P7AUE9_9HELO|nr:putative transporter [Hyphodiscus hymeniophilus]